MKTLTVSLRKILFLIILVTVSYSAFANTLGDTVRTKKQKHFAGFHLGFTKTELSGTEIKLMTSSPDAYQKSKMGLDIGFVYKYEPINWWYLKSGVGIITRKSYMIESGFTHPLRAELQFFNIPLVFGIQPVNLENSKINLSLETGFAANFDMGSNDGTSGGLHPDNKVEKASFIPSFILGGNLEIKASDKVMVFLNYKTMKDLADYSKRVYSLYDTDTQQVVEQHYDYRAASNHLTFGLLFIPNK